MKIAILTQPLFNNYGGLLQAFALQSKLKEMGHEVLTIDRLSRDPGLFIKFRSIIFRIFAHYIFGQKIVVRAWETKKEKSIILEHLRRFIRENIQTTEIIYPPLKFSDLSKYQFDIYIVGSDQVWRPEYSPYISNFFLDFLKDLPVKRIAYAASFGVDWWELSDKQTKVCATLAKKFEAVSVREKSGIELCRKYLGVDNAVHVLDPTLLLETEMYISLVEKDKVSPSEGDLMTYILDKSEENKLITEKIAKLFDLNPVFIMPEKEFLDYDKESVNQCIFPSVTTWLRGFMDAKYVVTDSFHGTVFSILFNKPFVTIGNKRRGQSRFNSLLEMFGFENRLVESVDDLTEELLTEPIKWNQVNAKLQERRLESVKFLEDALERQLYHNYKKL